MSRFASPAAASTGPDLSGPGYVASPRRLEMLRRRRSLRRVFRDLESGRWRRVLIDARETQFMFRELERQDGTIEPLLVKLNVVRLAMNLLATILVGNPPSIRAGEEFPGQRAAIEEIRRRCLFDTLIHRAARRVNVEAEAAIRVDIVPGMGVTLTLDSNDETFPVGPDGPDGQPSVWERRWVVERGEPNGKKSRFLRVERHAAPGGVGVVEQEAYETASDDPPVELTKLRRVPLARAFAAGVEPPPDRVETGVAWPLIVRLVNDYHDGEPAFVVPRDDLDQFDTLAKAVTGAVRAFAIHGEPKLRVGSSAVDPDTGLVRLQADAVIDDQGMAEYLNAGLNLTAMLDYMTKMVGLTLANLRVSPALTGVRLDGGATPDSYEKLRLESTGTLAAAHERKMYHTPALARLWTIATEFDARLPMRGYATGPVTAELFPEIPKDRAERVREARDMLDSGLIDERSAIAMVHGEAHADRIKASIDADREAKAERDRASVFGAFGGGGGDA